MKAVLPVFAYWNGVGAHYDGAFAGQWRAAFPDFRIYGREEAADHLQAHHPELADLFLDLAIPAAQSDVCRMAMLFAHGGLYTDCHFGFDDEVALRDFVAWAHDHAMVAVDNGLRRDVRHHQLLINGFLFAQPGHPLLADSLELIFTHLHQQRERERAGDFGPYSIWRLVGPWVLNLAAFANVPMDAPDPHREPWAPEAYPVVKTQYRDALTIVREEDLPVRRNVHRGYSVAGSHWSERERNEPLFLSTRADRFA